MRILMLTGAVLALFVLVREKPSDGDTGLADLAYRLPATDNRELSGGPTPILSPTLGPTLAPVPTATPEVRPSDVPDMRPPERAVRHPEGGLEALICSYDWECAVALCIVEAESRFNPAAYNASSGTSGLFQIRPSAHGERVGNMGYTWGQMFEAGPNVAVAYAIYVDWGGWSAWDGSPQCWAY